ncbi:hypothetical protein D1007_54012 [Hordeum vulgare]|nr:hypothetical protein D1007_54012 [Hordeum vulgare]
MGGQRRSWTVPVYILRTASGNIHVHQVALAGEDSPPGDGNQLHPLHGPHTTAEQAFQARLRIWLQLNGVFGPANGANQDEEEPVTPDQQHAPLLFFPPGGQIPTIIRGPFGIEIPLVSLHLIAWNPQYEEVVYLLNPAASARKVARKLWFEDSSSSSDQFELIPSSVVISELPDEDKDSQISDNSEGV